MSGSEFVNGQRSFGATAESVDGQDSFGAAALTVVDVWAQLPRPGTEIAVVYKFKIASGRLRIELMDLRGIFDVKSKYNTRKCQRNFFVVQTPSINNFSEKKLLSRRLSTQ